MRWILRLFVLLAVAAGVAMATRPGPGEFDAMLDAAIRDRVANTDVGAQGEALPALALAACKLRPTDCVRLVRETLEVRFEQRLFWTTARVEGLGGRSVVCRGAFARFACDRPLTE
jgi:hypothetical protein